MSSCVQPILVHHWPLLPAGYLPTGIASDARNDLMGAPSRVCVMLRSEGMSPQDYFRERPIRGHSIVNTAPWQELQCHKVCDKGRVAWFISLTWDQVKFRCMQADGDKIKIDLIKYQEHKGPSPRIFTVIGFLPSKKMNKDLELDLASGFWPCIGMECATVHMQSRVCCW